MKCSPPGVAGMVRPPSSGATPAMVWRNLPPLAALATMEVTAVPPSRASSRPSRGAASTTRRPHSASRAARSWTPIAAHAGWDRAAAATARSMSAEEA